MSHDTHALLSRSTIGAALLVFTGAANVASQPVLLKPGSSAACVELLSVVNDFGTAYSMALGVTPHTMVEVGSSFERQVYDRDETSNQELSALGIQPFVILNLVQPGDASPISFSAEMAWRRDWFDSSDISVLDDLTGKGWEVGSRFGGLVTSDRSRLHLEVGSGYGRYRTKRMDHAEGTVFHPPMPHGRRATANIAKKSLTCHCRCLKAV